jgi:hypothetical protein
VFTALFVLLSCGTAGRSQEDARRDRAGRALERLGARTGLSAQAVWPNLTKEAKKLQSQNKYALVVIGTDWKGGVEGLEHLRDLPGLRGVMFSHPDFSDKWCECLRDKTDLKEVYLCGEHFTDKGLRSLQRLRDLEALSLLFTQVTDEGLRDLEGMTKLRWLCLMRTRVTDAGMAHLRRATGLRYLNLGLTSVTGSGLVHLKGATQLEWLQLSGPLVLGYDAGLRHLQGMTHLKYLYIGDLTATEAEMKALLRQCKGLDHVKTRDMVYTRDGWKDREWLSEDGVKQRMRKRVLDNIKD